MATRANTGTESAPKAQPIEESRRLIETRAEYLEAADFLFGIVQHELRIFDADARQLALNAPARIAQLRAFLRHLPRNRLLIVVHTPEWLRTSTPRFLTLMTDHTEQVAVRQTQAEGTRAQDCFVLADDAHMVRRGAQSHPRGVALTASVTGCAPIRQRFDELWEGAVPCISTTTLGL